MSAKRAHPIVQIIDRNEEDVGSAGFRMGDCRKRKEQQQCVYEFFHEWMDVEL
jgi:hypothetical protein